MITKKDLLNYTKNDHFVREKIDEILQYCKDAVDEWGVVGCCVTLKYYFKKDLNKEEKDKVKNILIKERGFDEKDIHFVCSVYLGEYLEILWK